MAVFKPDLLNLAPSYANIEHVLERKADIASKDTGDIGYVQAIAQPIAAEAGKLGDMWIQKNMTDYKARLENEIKRMESEREFANSGGILITPKNRADLELNMGVPPGTIPESLVGQRLKSPEQLTELFVKPHKDKEFELTVEELKKKYPDKAEAIDLFAKKSGAGSAKEIGDLINPPAPKTKQWVHPGTKERVSTDENGFSTFMSGPLKGQPVEALSARPEPASIADLTQYEKEKLDAAKKEVRKVTKVYTDPLDKLDKLRGLVEENNPATLINIKAEDLLTSGLTGGRLNVKYIEKEGFSPGVAAKIKQGLTKLMGDQALSEENQKWVLQYIDYKESIERKHLETAIADEASSVGISGAQPLIQAELFKHVGRYVKGDKPIPNVTTKAEYDKLQSGTVYTWNGEGPHTKP